MLAIASIFLVRLLEELGDRLERLLLLARLFHLVKKQSVSLKNRSERVSNTRDNNFVFFWMAALSIDGVNDDDDGDDDDDEMLAMLFTDPELKVSHLPMKRQNKTSAAF